MERVADPEKLKERRTLLATTVISGHGLKHLYSAAFSIVLPEIKDSLMLSNLATAALVTSREFSSGVVTMPAGFLADRFSNRWSQILTASMALIALGYLLSGALGRYWAIILAVILTGMGTAMWHPAAIAALSHRFPHKLGFTLSLHGAGGSAGEVLGPLIAGGLLLVLAWDQLLIWSFFPAAITAVVVWTVLRGMRGQKGVSSVREYFSAAGGLFQNRVLMAVVVLSSVRSMSHQIIVIFVPIYLREELGYSTLIVGVYVSLLQVMGIATHPLMGTISDRYGRKAALVPGMIAFGLLCIALAFADPGVQLTLTIIAIGAFIFTFHHIFIAAAIDISPAELHGTSVALIYTGSMVIGGLGSITAGVLADAVSVEATFVYAGILVIVAALGLFVLKIPRFRPEAEASSPEG